MKLNEVVEDQAAKNQRMKAQLAHSRLQDQVNQQLDRIKRLESEVLNLKQTVTSLISKLGPR